MKDKLYRVKGFTLTEMIVVLAIIGILTAILIPSMSGYYWKSRVKASNSDAKMVYNAAQTSAQKYLSADRVFDSDHSDQKSGLEGVMLISYSNGNFSYVTGANALSTPSIPVGGTHTDIKEAAVAGLVRDVNTTVSGADTKCWSVYIDNYIVQGSIAADSMATSYVGYYSSGRTFATERTRTPYSSWLGTGTEAAVDSLTEVASRYNS